MPNAALQNTFYLVSIITMSLITLLLVGLVIAIFYLRAKVSELTDIVEKRFNEAKDVVTHPKRMAETVGEAIVETAVNQVEKFTKNNRSRKSAAR